MSGHDIIKDDGADQPTVKYEDMDLTLEEIDLFFVYPWPGEQAMMLKLFDCVAGEGAILIAYYGDRDICIYQKTEDYSDDEA